MAGKDTNIGAKRAREAREELGLAPDEPVGCVLGLVVERLDLPVVVAALPDGVAGACWRAGDRAVLWVSGADTPVRRRFTLAHEVGHLRCGHDGTIPVETFLTLSGKSSDAREVQANAFAAELLVPAAGVRAEVAGGDPTLDDVVRLAARYGVSCFVALYRLNTLGLAGDAYDALHEEVRAGEPQLPPFDDALGRLDSARLPWLAPALRGSALDAYLAGEVSTGAVAALVGCAPEHLAAAADAIAA